MQPLNKEKSPLIPFANIALTFSGGGFRAAAYSLGALSYLNYLKIDNSYSSGEYNLLSKVSYISSTSGGSFTNALYSSYMHKGKTFENFYKKLKKEMRSQDLLEQVFEILNDNKQWHKSEGKQRNIINAFAKAYDKILFEEETFGVFWNKTYVPHFEVCFNCTEFYRGLGFRFQTEGDNSQYQVIGNKYLHFSTKHIDTIKKIKLADMVAASSCFPAGFEPIIYPQDFSYSASGAALNVDELKSAMQYRNYQEVVRPITTFYGFMDGGITDNQGLYSTMGADKKRRRRVKSNPFDLIIVTDVTSYFMEKYKPPVAENKPRWRLNIPLYYLNKARAILKNFKSTIFWVTVFLIPAFISSVVMSIISINKGNVLAFGFISGFFLVLLILILIIRKMGIVKWLWENEKDIHQDTYINCQVKNNKLFSENIMLAIIRFLKVTKIGFLEQMVKSRIMSLLSLVLDVNLKQTRRLIYEMFYNDPIWDNRRVPNFVYELSSYNKASRTFRFNSPVRLRWVATQEDKRLLLDNCEALNDIAEEARTMGTTLWFDKDDKDNKKLKKIISAGQFTTCCNLLEYVISLERKRVEFDNDTKRQLEILKKKLTEDFIRFKDNPYFLYDLLEN